MGPQAGRKVLMLQTISAREEEEYGTDQLGRMGGFSLHTGVSVNTRERNTLERICLGGPAGIYPAPHIGGAPGIDRSGDGEICPEDSVSGWNYACVLWAVGLMLCCGMIAHSRYSRGCTGGHVRGLVESIIEVLEDSTGRIPKQSPMRCRAADRARQCAGSRRVHPTLGCAIDEIV